jgi:hypothetical protein
MGAGVMDYREMRLAALKRWWRQTKNPLFAWEAIDFCLNAQPPRAIPEWCIAYLAQAAAALTHLHWATVRDEISPTEAFKQSRGALGFGRERQKTAFAKGTDDAFLLRVALNEDQRKPVIEQDPVDGTARLIGENDWVTEDRVRRRLRRGRKLLGG